MDPQDSCGFRAEHRKVKPTRGRQVPGSGVGVEWTVLAIWPQTEGCQAWSADGLLDQEGCCFSGVGKGLELVGQELPPRTSPINLAMPSCCPEGHPAP